MSWGMSIGAAAVLLAALPLGAADQPRAVVEVSERSTSVGWVYDYRVTNTGTCSLQSITIGRDPEPEHALALEPITVVAPPGWKSGRPEMEFRENVAPTFDVMWFPPKEPPGHPTLRPGAIAEGLSLVTVQRCPSCVEATFKVMSYIHEPPKGSWTSTGKLRRAQIQAGPTPLLVEVVDPTPREVQYVKGKTTTQATVSDPSRVVDLYFEINGTRIVGTPLEGFRIRWDTRQAKLDGDIPVEAVVTDADGWTYRSRAVAVWLRNGFPEAMAPY